MPDANCWGSLIKSLRIERGYTQRTLSTQAKVNRNTLRRIEGGETKGEVEVLERILRHLGYELEALECNRSIRVHEAEGLALNPERRAALARHRVLSLPPALLLQR